MSPTKHFHQRAFERGLSREVEAFILTWGTTIEAPHDAVYFTIVRRYLPFHLQNCALAQRVQDWILVVANDGAIMTCYKRRDAWHSVRRERERRNGKRRAA